MTDDPAERPQPVAAEASAPAGPVIGTVRIVAAYSASDAPQSIEIECDGAWLPDPHAVVQIITALADVARERGPRRTVTP